VGYAKACEARASLVYTRTAWRAYLALTAFWGEHERPGTCDALWERQRYRLDKVTVAGTVHALDGNAEPQTVVGRRGAALQRSVSESGTCSETGNLFGATRA